MSKDKVEDLNENIALSIKWAAAEYKFVSELKSELELLNQETDVSAEKKVLRKSLRILRYIGRAERRTYRFEQIVKKDMEQIYQDLRIWYYGPIESKKFVDSWRETTKELEIEGDILLKYSSMYEGVLKGEIDKAEILTKLEKTQPEKAAIIHAEFMKLLDKIRYTVSDLDRWVTALEADLKKAHDLVAIVPKHSLGPAMAILYQYDFPVKDHQREALFMTRHYDVIKRWSQNDAKWHLFKYGLPKLCGLINDKSWQILVDGIDKLNTEKYAGGAFYIHGLEAVQEMINEQNWPIIVDGFIDLYKACSSAVFEHGILTIKDLINEITWPGLVAIGKCVGRNAFLFYFHGVRSFAKVINKQTWPIILEGLLQMAGNEGFTSEAWYWAKTIDPIMNETTWSKILLGLVQLSKVKHSKYLIKCGLYNSRELIKQLSFSKTVDRLILLSTILKSEEEWEAWETELPGAISLFVFAPLNVDEILSFYKSLSGSKSNIKRLGIILGRTDVRTMPFLLYLIQNKPKMVIEIFSKLFLLNVSGADFRQELDLFLGIASPIVLMEDNLNNLKKIIALFNILASSEKRFFLKKLNLSLKTFQGMSFDFLKSLQATEGFGEIENYSFVEFVYIYLRYCQQPDLKFDKLQKSILKMQKEERKILALIADKELASKLNEMDRLKLKGGLKSIGEQFLEPLLYMFTEYTDEKLVHQIEVVFKVKIKDVAKEMSNPNIQDALTLLKRLEQYYSSQYNLCFALIQNYFSGKTYPKTKNLFDSYPWNLLQNIAWLKAHCKNKWWFTDFRQRYTLSANPDSNIPQRISHHLKEAERILSQLKFPIPELNIENVERAYKELSARKDKINSAMIADLKTQINALKSLEGSLSAENKGGREIIIQPEFDPLEILQMGNYVQGSCLATTGINFWSAVVNAVEVNKRVLWAKDLSGSVLGRVLIAVDNQNRIVRFPTYYSINTNLDPMFNDYITQLAQKCQFGLNGDIKSVQHLLCEQWYTDSEEKIE